LQERVNFLLAQYQHCSNQDLIIAVQKLEKKLGLQQCLQAQELLRENNRTEFCKVMLKYYDKAYDFSFAKRKNRTKCD
jgi:hypothetical protein